MNYQAEAELIWGSGWDLPRVKLPAGPAHGASYALETLLAEDQTAFHLFINLTLWKIGLPNIFDSFARIPGRLIPAPRLGTIASILNGECFGKSPWMHPLWAHMRQGLAQQFDYSKEEMDCMTAAVRQGNEIAEETLARMASMKQELIAKAEIDRVYLEFSPLRLCRLPYERGVFGVGVLNEDLCVPPDVGPTKTLYVFDCSSAEDQLEEVCRAASAILPSDHLVGRASVSPERKPILVDPRLAIWGQVDMAHFDTGLIETPLGLLRKNATPTEIETLCTIWSAYWRKRESEFCSKNRTIQDEALANINAAKGHVRMGNFRDAVVAAFRSAAFLCEERIFKSPNPSQEVMPAAFFERLKASRAAIERDFGLSLYNDINSLRIVRNNSDHNSRFQPDARVANEAILRATLIIQKLISS